MTAKCNLLCCWTLVCGLGLSGTEPPRTGPETEKRFPPLKVPAGFRATLFACDPLIEYPSAIALGPRPDTLFVAIDYMTGLGTEIIRRDEIRLIEDTNADGYADRAIVYADKFNSIQGLTFHAGVVYAMHAPFLTALRDRDGDGKADERRDLLIGLGLTPEKNPVRLHCANGIVMGHDGWLYLAMGDNGCDVPRPEGDRLILNGGGILRCRPDGRDLHVFASGLRNIYDVALDDSLNVFVRDNENDGGDYKIRVCHSFISADHGYPYLYYERPEEALPSLADLGLGSSAGGVAYLEPQFPAEFRGNLFFCEWGRSVVRYPLAQTGNGFAPVKEHEFASGAANDPYGFKPTDLVVERDGSLIVADWCDDQRPKRGRGRIYRIRHGEGKARALKPVREDVFTQLESESFYERTQAQAIFQSGGANCIEEIGQRLGKNQYSARARGHVVWILAQANTATSRDMLFRLAETDPDSAVQAQAIRAIADLTDPVFVHHRLDAPAGDAKVAARIAALADSKSPRIFLEVFTALGRLRWPETPAWLHKTLKDPDRTLAHAAMQSLRRSDNWPAVLKLLELPDSAPIRPIALRAVADQAVPTLIDGIIALLQKEENAARRAAYADLLTRVYKKPPAWTYWGYRPPPRPPNSVLWERTDSIGRALDRVLADADRGARLAVLRRMLREKIPTKPDTLADWLAEELDDTRLAVIIEALREHPVQIARDPLKAVVTSQTKPVAARLLALTVIVANLDSTPDGWFPELLKSLEDGPVLEAALQHLPKRSWPGAAEFLFDKLTIARPAVRAAALEALAELRPTADQPQRHSAVFLKLMSDTDVRVRRAACQVAGSLQIRGTADRLLDLANDPEATVRQAALDSLRQLKDLRALKSAINALPEPITESAALQYIAELGGPDHSAIIARHAREHVSTGVLTMAIRALNAWSQNAPGRRAEVERSITELHGSSGVLMCWQVASPLTDEAAERWTRRVPEFTPTTKAIDGLTWNTVVGDGIEGRIRWSNPKPQSQWVAYADISVPEPMTVQFLTSGNMPAKVWLNGKLVFERDQRGAFQPDAERFDAELAKGVTRVCLRMSSGASTPLEFHLRFRRKSSRVEHEKLMQAALSRAGNAERGRKVFLDIQKSQCLKCHRLGDQGERIGPELTGVGSRFARVHLIESILEPSRTVVPGFQTHVIALSDGRVITGVKVAESDRSLTLADQQGKKIELQKSSIDRQQPSSTSTMPEGLEKPLTTDEFVDLIAFLVSQKNAR